MGLYLGNIEIPQVNYTTIVRDATAANYQAKTVTPTKATQTVTPSNGYIALSQVTVNPIPSNYISPTGNLSITGNGTGIDVSGYATVSVNVPTGGGGITPSGTYTINSSGSHNVTNYATANVPAVVFDQPSTLSKNFTTTNGVRKWTASWNVYVDSAGWADSGVQQPKTETFNAVASNTTITPSTTSQTVGGVNYMMEGPVTVAGDSDLIASNIKSGVNIFGVTGTYSGSSSSPRLQAKTGINPSTSSQTIQPDTGYDGLSSVQINAMTTMTLPTSPTTTYSGTSIGNNITRSTSTRYLNIPVGYNSTARYYTISGVANGTVTAPSTITGTSSSVSRSGTTLTLTKTVSVTPNVTTAGYIANGTAGNSSISLSVTDANFIASNIKSGVTIFGLTGTYEGSGGGTTPTGVSIGTTATTLTSSNNTITFSGLLGEPTSFVVITNANLTPASNIQMAMVVYDGTVTIGQSITNQYNSQVTYQNSCSYTYNNNTLSVIGVDPQFQANQYKLVYSYNGSNSNIKTIDQSVGSGATSITFTGLTGRPSYFSCIFKSNFNTSSGYQRVIGVVFDGTDIYGLEMDSAAKPAAHWSYTYNNGSLTITSNNTNQGGYFHQPGNYQLTYAVN